MELNGIVTLKCKSKKDINGPSNSKKYLSEKNNISFKEFKSKENKKDEDLFLTEKIFAKNDKIRMKKKTKTKIMLIKSLLTPPIKNSIFDGYAVNRKKYSFEELIKKVSQKEKRECIEKNKLFKSPYPLIKFLSNRKVYNNTSSLLCELLDNDISKMTKEQLLTINKKDENRKNMNCNNLSYSCKYFNIKSNYNLTKNKKYSTINIKRNIRLYDYLNSKNHFISGTHSKFNNFKDKDFIINKFKKENLPLLHRYIKDQCVNTNDCQKDNFISQGGKLNRTEKTIYLNTELDIITKKLKKENFSNNSTINNDKNDSFIIRRTTNNLFNKGNIKDNPYKTFV